MASVQRAEDSEWQDHQTVIFGRGGGLEALDEGPDQYPDNAPESILIFDIHEVMSGSEEGDARRETQQAHTDSVDQPASCNQSLPWSGDLSSDRDTRPGLSLATAVITRSKKAKKKERLKKGQTKADTTRFIVLAPPFENVSVTFEEFKIEYKPPPTLVRVQQPARPQGTLPPPRPYSCTRFLVCAVL